MIYLIDDNQGNQRVKKYQVKYITDGSFDGLLISLEKLEKDCDMTFFNHATCIMMHNTIEDVENGQFIPGSFLNKTKIITQICEYGDKIPLVLFTNDGDKALKLEKSYLFMNKSTFYSNLYDFLTFYRENGKLELKILAYGKDFIRVEANNLIQAIINKLPHKDQSELLSIKEIDLKSFRRIIEISDTDISFTKLIAELEDNPVTVAKFRHCLSQINLSFSKYGKNIYGWLP